MPRVLYIRRERKNNLSALVWWALPVSICTKWEAKFWRDFNFVRWPVFNKKWIDNKMARSWSGKQNFIKPLVMLVIGLLFNHAKTIFWESIFNTHLEGYHNHDKKTTCKILLRVATVPQAAVDTKIRAKAAYQVLFPQTLRRYVKSINATPPKCCILGVLRVAGAKHSAKSDCDYKTCRRSAISSRNGWEGEFKANFGIRTTLSHWIYYNCEVYCSGTLRQQPWNL